MRWSTVRQIVIGVAFAAAGGCGFAPGATGGATGSGNSGGPLGTGASTGSGLIGGGAAQNGNGGIPGMNCAEVNNPVNRLPPDILIVLDASGSMNENTDNDDCGGMGCGAQSKWGLLTPALNQVVGQTEAEVNWGLKMFADMDSQCGVAPNTVSVPVAVNNAQEIAQVITGRTDATGQVTMGSYTPTRRAEDAAVAYLNTVSSMNPKYILLATDGQPNCMGNSSNTTNDTAGAVGAVANALSEGYPTFVVGISAPAGTANDALNMMANAGGLARMGSPQYYPVTSADEFVAVLRTLVTIAGTCVFPVPEPPNNDTDRAHIGVRINGMEIPRDLTHTNGWDYTSDAMTAVQIYGPNCTGIENGSITNVQVVFKCIVI